MAAEIGTLPPAPDELPPAPDEVPERSTFQKVIGPVISARNAVGEGYGQLVDMGTVPLRELSKGNLNLADIMNRMRGAAETPSGLAKTAGPIVRDISESAVMPWSKVPGLAGTAIRAGQSGVLGAGQGLLEKGELKDAAVRGGISAVASPAAEGLAALAGKAWRSLPGAAERITRADAERLGAAIGDISDPLKGATTAKEIQQLAGGQGQRRLSAAKETIVGEIERLSGNPKFNLPTFGEELTLREANRRLTTLGQQAFGGKKNPELILQWRAMEQDLLSSLDTINPDLSGMYKAANQEWMKGTYLLNFLSLQPAYKETQRGVELATPYLQKRVTAPKTAKTLLEKLGAGDYDMLVRALKRGATEGADVIRNTSPFSLRGLLASGGLGAAGGLAGGPAGSAAALLPYALPNALSTYVGSAPGVLGATGKGIAAMTGKGATDVVREVTR